LKSLKSGDLKEISTIDPRGTHIVGSWTLGEMLWEQAEFENETPEARKEKSISSVGLEGHVSSDR
jgi:hypothetical protein